jgi:hypothetical protein
LRYIAALFVLSLGCTQSLASGGYATASQAEFQVFEADHRQQVAELQAHLTAKGVGDVVPVWTLLRQGTDYAALGEPAFAMPPVELWDGIVPTLEVLRDDVIPRVGTIEVVSGFRTERYNERAGGASKSRHRWFEAVDVVPQRTWTRTELHTDLLGWWAERGPEHEVGLGLYKGVRFHVDTHRHRRW